MNDFTEDILVTVECNDLPMSCQGFNFQNSHMKSSNVNMEVCYKMMNQSDKLTSWPDFPLFQFYQPGRSSFYERWVSGHWSVVQSLAQTPPLSPATVELRLRLRLWQGTGLLHTPPDLPPPTPMKYKSKWKNQQLREISWCPSKSQPAPLYSVVIGGKIAQ